MRDIAERLYEQEIKRRYDIMKKIADIDIFNSYEYYILENAFIEIVYNRDNDNKVQISKSAETIYNEQILPLLDIKNGAIKDSVIQLYYIINDKTNKTEVKYIKILNFEKEICIPTIQSIIDSAEFVCWVL